MLFCPATRPSRSSRVTALHPSTRLLTPSSTVHGFTNREYDDTKAPITLKTSRWYSQIVQSLPASAHSSQNSKSLRRLASEHAQLHTNELPPNYLWPASNAVNDGSDLSQLTVLLAGPESTPFSSGVFTLSLSIPATYPATPPTATFKTKIFHPNVDPSNGAVCVDTLKRDWKPDLKLYDILVVISCLLISPNPASALNAEAGRLCEGDFASFERRARTWVSVHARCPKDLAQAVEEARQRGDKLDQEQGQSNSFATSVTSRRVRGKRKDLHSGSEPLADSTTNMLGISLQETGVIDGSKTTSILRSSPAPESQIPATPQQQLSASMSPPPVIGQALSKQAINLQRFDSFLSTDSALLSTFQWKTDQQPVKSLIERAPSPWLDWQCQSVGDGKKESTPERSKRQKLEQQRFQAADGCLKKYNSGAFGAKKGMKRL